MAGSFAFASEAELVDALVVHLTRQHPDAIVARSVPLYDRCIDLVMYDGRHVHAVECKMSHVSKAMTQARRYQFGAEFSYVCLPKRKSLQARLLHAAEEFGIGVWVCSSKSLEVVLEPKPSEHVFTPARRRVEELVRCRSSDSCDMVPPQMRST